MSLRFYANANYHLKTWDPLMCCLWLVGSDPEETWLACQKWDLEPMPEMSNRKLYAGKEVDLLFEEDPLQAVHDLLLPVMAEHEVKWIKDLFPEQPYQDAVDSNTFPTLEELIETLGG